MKKIRIYTGILILIFLGFFACQKDESSIKLPTVDTESADEIFANSAKIGGRVTDDGGTTITDRGVYWGTSTSPETSGTKFPIGTGTGIFDTTLTDLTPGVKYYVKAYAQNSKGTSYGDETFFTTQLYLPSVVTSAPTEIAPNSARIGGEITDNGGTDVIERGVYWSAYENAQSTGIKLSMGSGSGTFSQVLAGLQRGTKYYVRAYATNSKGTAYGIELNFTTPADLPSVATIPVTDITSHSAKVGGNVSADGSSAVTERGVYYGTAASPQTTGIKVTIGSGTGTFSATVDYLTPATTYYVTAFATNNTGTSYGTEESFVTLGQAPAISSQEASLITASGVTLQAYVYPNYLSTTVTFEYGTSTSYGNTVTASESPVTDSGTVSAEITGLSSNTRYYYRVKAENALGVTYGADSSFVTTITGITGTVTDADGNTYNTIGIGYQDWMTENLKTTKFNDGTNISLVTNDSAWNTLSTPAYCWYNNDKSSYKDSYGALYNWYVVETGSLCPTGWHVPSQDDWNTLIEYIGANNEPGGQLKSTRTAPDAHPRWNSPNTGATNSTGFSALPGGERMLDGESALFDYIGVEGDWWTSNEYSTLNATYYFIRNNYSNVYNGYSKKKNGFSVRCVKN